MLLFYRQQLCINNTMAVVRGLHVIRYEASNDNTIVLNHFYHRLFPENLLCLGYINEYLII
jgi:hypothetical protein